MTIVTTRRAEEQKPKDSYVRAAIISGDFKTDDEHRSPRPLPESYNPTRNITTGRRQCPFVLPRTFPSGCEGDVCHGSTMEKHGVPLGGVEREEDEIWQEASEYLREFYAENQLSTYKRDERLREVKKLIFQQGYYTHTYEELSFGVKTAWRNSRRCVMRSQWNTIQTIDKRHVTDGREMLEACFNHMRTATNGGRIRPNVTIFPQKLPGREGPRIWNPQLIRYAGYKLKDGTIIGDSANLEITEIAIELGWKPKFGRWDILPLIVMPDGGEPIWRDMPQDCILEIPITHPTYDWFEELDLRWNDHPPVSSFVMTIGGIDYTAAPFSGWYLGTEIASRNLADEHRYNALPEIARRLGLPTNNRSLWKDRAVLELNQAVLHSFDKAKVTIVDHHSASDSFVAHYEKEIRTRGHCTADWVWLTPPLSSSTTRIFHQEMYSYLCKPAVLGLLETPWETYWRRKGIVRNQPVEMEATTETVDSRDTITVAYGSETGTAMRLAETLHKFLLHRRLKVAPDLVELNDIDLNGTTGTLLLITSSFGEGEPPTNAHIFAKTLSDPSVTSSCRFAVFGLGSSLYAETFQKFPKVVDSSMARIGGRRIIPLQTGDDTTDAEKAFDTWLTTLAVAIEVGTETTVSSTLDSATPASIFAQQLYHLSDFQDIALSGRHPLYDVQEGIASDRAAYHIELSSTDGTALKYIEGDHISLLPPTDTKDLAAISTFIRSWGDEIVDGFTVASLLENYVDWTTNTTTAEQKSYVDTILKSTPTAETMADLIRTLPLKKPRQFSIASTPLYHPDTLHLAMAHVDGGQVSSPLASSSSYNSNPFTLKAKIRPSKFRLPVDLSIPIILIGTGTGTGPLRGMMHGRLAAHAKSNSNFMKASIMCILGFRSPGEQFYRDEFRAASSKGVVTFTAYSRVGSREYVGDIIVQQSNAIVPLLERGAAVFICGNHGMGKSVEASLEQAVIYELGLKKEEGQSYITRMKQDGKLFISTYTRSSSTAILNP